MTDLGPVAVRILEGLAEPGRVRVTLAELRRAHHAAAPDVAAASDQRERLHRAVMELARARRILLPSTPRSWDRSADPPLPRSVRLVREEAGEERPGAAASRFPWRPELAFAARLTLDETGFRALRRVNEWLRDRPGPHRVVPARERSLEVFGDEKAIDRLSRRRLFGPGRLGYRLLACEPLSPPFVWREVGGGDALLVVENHDTFHSLSRVLRGRYTPVGVVAYGSGRAFERSVGHARELRRTVRRIVYFGDLDAPGLRIPRNAGRRAVRSGLPPVFPAPGLYRLLLERGETAPYAHAPSAAEARKLVGWLPADLRARAEEILLAGRRIAQEWVGLELLSRERGWIEGLV